MSIGTHISERVTEEKAWAEPKQIVDVRVSLAPHFIVKPSNSVRRAGIYSAKNDVRVGEVAIRYKGKTMASVVAYASKRQRFAY